MERLTSDQPLPDRLRGGIVALGNFDGVHRGHQAVIANAVDRARLSGRPALVATFDPHPARLFRPDLPPFALTTLDQRAELLGQLGVDAMVTIRFDTETASISPNAFVTDWLATKLGATGVVTGEDFTFGAHRAGTIATLIDLGRQHGIAAEAVPAVADAGGVISSTRIRDALRGGNLREAARLLTRPFAIRGQVQHGDKRGRELGFPTANLPLGDALRPAYGIYAVRALLPGGRTVDGVANLGIRPSFDPPVELLEPWFFDFDGDLYGETIEVALIDYLRPEARFDDMAALVAQMHADAAEARRRLAAPPPVA